MCKLNRSSVSTCGWTLVLSGPGKRKKGRKNTKKRETERKFILLLNILGWPKSLFRKGRKEGRKARQKDRKHVLKNILG